METIRIIFFVACAAIILVGLYKRPEKKGKYNVEDENHGEKDMSETNNKRSKEELQFTLESVNSWLNNCDQKAGMLLAVIGVTITILLTGDFVKFIRAYIFIPFVEFCKNQGEHLFSWGRFTVFALLVVAAVFLIVSCYYLFRAIGANINYKKMYVENTGLVKNSYIFFGSISSLKYEDFKITKINYEDDLMSQIYVNSKIATTKFQNYNKGLSWFKLLLLVIGLLFVAVMIVQ